MQGEEIKRQNMESKSQDAIKRWVGLLVQQEEKRKIKQQRPRGPTLNKGNGEIKLKKNKTPWRDMHGWSKKERKGKRKRKKMNKQHARGEMT
jgi:hypothetical protein